MHLYKSQNAGVVGIEHMATVARIWWPYPAIRPRSNNHAVICGGQKWQWWSVYGDLIQNTAEGVETWTSEEIQLAVVYGDSYFIILIISYVV